MTACSIEGCGKPVEKRGWCGAHYQRWRVHGDPLAGRTPWGEPLRFFQDVVLTYDGDDCLIWPYSRVGNGYGNMLYDGKTQVVSRLVCEAAHGAPPTPEHEAAHSCGKGHEACVTKRHLSWKTCAENKADMVLHGTAPRGSRQGGSKLSDAAVLQIRKLRGSGLSCREIGIRFGVSANTVNSIHLGKTWAWLEGAS